jgi:hypothetical protein
MLVFCGKGKKVGEGRLKARPFWKGKNCRTVEKRWKRQHKRDAELGE